MHHRFVRRPLFTACATLTVLGATGAAYLTAAPATDAARAAFVQPAPLTEQQAAAADAQALADAGDADGQRLLEERARQAEAARQRQQAAAQQAAEAAAAAAAAEQARQEAAERATREAQRDPRSVARALVADWGWGSSQFDCLDSLWTKESGWRYDADNPTSSAYGIPQALPGAKMASAGEDWATNPVTQIRWGLGYIADSYGTPCSAWNHSQSYNWY